MINPPAETPPKSLPSNGSASLKGTAFDLTGQTALITGGGTGLGLAMAQCLATAGARVVLVGRRPEELAKACAQIGPTAFALPGDVTRLEDAPSLVERAEAQAGPITLLINNAGVHLKKAATETTDVEFAAVLQTHVFGAFAITREAGKRMVARGAGSVLFTASMTSLIGLSAVVAYSAAKSAYVGLVRSLATEWGPHGIRVNALAPGWIASDMLAKVLDGDPARREKILSRTPLGRLGDPTDIGWAAVYLASPAARFVTGVVLPVDGGAAGGF
ncbi:SDR family NAD(P)-dependent oxidoreductase [Synoicihabitans lomoniglobus]|uniref:SDR family oxidoreductase n=1 Tax=Synoicihabitans lomoniglobus TaxID=2909285 RepID=A0AAE9ZT55_9BACT|nr:SDR family oxidoreductase [Opitutaceae bacterium LMO-M01]WED64725.1 SDR family oxidoreductase [Opitutaceae bacterium LMO-M01]